LAVHKLDRHSGIYLTFGLFSLKLTEISKVDSKRWAIMAMSWYWSPSELLLSAMYRRRRVPASRFAWKIRPSQTHFVIPRLSLGDGTWKCHGRMPCTAHQPVFGQASVPIMYAFTLQCTVTALSRGACLQLHFYRISSSSFLLKLFLYLNLT
jgi:hypothetical protein